MIQTFPKASWRLQRHEFNFAHDNDKLRFGMHCIITDPPFGRREAFTPGSNHHNKHY